MTCSVSYQYFTDNGHVTLFKHVFNVTLLFFFFLSFFLHSCICIGFLVLICQPFKPVSLCGIKPESRVVFGVSQFKCMFVVCL